jgi:hypothetical protein
MVTFVTPAGLVHPKTVCVREYVPLASTVTPPMVGFCDADVNAFGPVQLYELAPFGRPVKLNV